MLLRERWPWCPGSPPLGPGGPPGELAAGRPGSPRGRPSGASLFSSTSPPLESRVSGLEGGPAGSLLVCVCVIGVVCISFLVLGLMIAVLLPRVSSTWSPKCAALGSASYRGEQPGVGGRRGRHWRLQGEGPMGRCLPG